MKYPEYYDPYVGKVYGNILDYYDNPAYNLRLYMIDDASSKEAPDEFGGAGPELVAEPSQTVILAQTGVTATTIDKLVIKSVITANDGPKAQTVDFEIFQPGAANFLDQIQMAKVYLGQPNVSMPTVFLEVSFMGYKESDLGPSDVEWDPDTGGQPERIIGPWRYKLNVTNITVDINETGSTYGFTCVAVASFAFREPIFKIPKTLTTIGKTITEHVEDLKKKLNEWHSEAANNEVPDEIDFDLSLLIGSSSSGQGSSYDLISDETLISNSDPDAEDVNRPMNETFDAEDAVARQEALENNPVDTGEQTEETFEGDKISVKEGTSIHDYFLTLLSMNEEYISKITRKSDITDPEDPNIDNDRAFTTWFRVNAENKQLDFDKSRNSFAYNYKFIPTLYKSTRRDVAVDVDETRVDNARRTIDEMVGNGSILKSYNYMFTGLNDNITDLQIKLDNGLSLLQPVKGGFIGDVSVTASEQLANTVPEDADTSLAGQIQGLFDKAQEAVDKDKITGFFDELGNIADQVGQGALNGLVNQLADFTGRAANDIAGFIQNATGADARAFVDQLDAATRKALAANSKIQGQPAPPTVDPGVVPPDYEATFSDYRYGQDFLIPGQTYPEVTKLEDLGYINLQDKLNALEDPEGAMEVKQEVNRSTTMPSKTEGGTYKAGSPQNTLFGFIAGQHADNVFMMEIDLGLRGDPWFLGRGKIAEGGDSGGGSMDKTTEISQPSDAAGANFYKDDNCFFLNINAPIQYDLDYTDEDSELNSGYWDMSGEARTFGGVYRMIHVTNSFDAGTFSVQLKGQRILGPDKIEKRPPNTEG